MAKFKITTSVSCGFRFAEALPQSIPIISCPKCGSSCIQSDPVELLNDVARILTRTCESDDVHNKAPLIIVPLNKQGAFVA